MTPHGWTLALVGLENFILINTILSVIGFGIAAGLRAGKRIHSWPPQACARLYAAAILIPPLASAWLVCASLLPAIWMGGKRWEQEHQPAHTMHLLNSFTTTFDPTLGYATFAFATLAAVIAAYGAMTAYFRISRVIEQLEIGAQPVEAEQIKTVAETCKKHGIAVGLVVSNYPFSFVWGYLNTKLVVSTGLLNALSKEELATVLEHETAHHARRDNLAKLALRIARCLSPAFPLTNLLYRWWGEQVEMICDEIAANHTQAPVELAGALVRLKRLTVAAPPLEMRPAASGLFGNGKDNFERRVEHALSLADQIEFGTGEKLSRSCARAALILGAAFVLSLSALFAFAPLSIHTFIESILQVF